MNSAGRIWKSLNIIFCCKNVMNKCYIVPDCIYSALVMLQPTITITWKRKSIFTAIQHKRSELGSFISSNLVLLQAEKSALQYDNKLWNSCVCCSTNIWNTWWISQTLNGRNLGAHFSPVRRLDKTWHQDAFKCHTHTEKSPQTFSCLCGGSLWHFQHLPVTRSGFRHIFVKLFGGVKKPLKLRRQLLISRG